ncbi:YkgJ family cysteine cluster protein [uncultured Methanomethylovorans sp.]|uniref:YkgJ family cysteine cluster protein n=1 Tax=uncultured Methanomethylovorans sp. TaxID=183759 RepID=UPI002AA83717|nr:YkgJ family cysteine cluster protein [uncultured Methanomethylovorans sp.]
MSFTGTYKDLLVQNARRELDQAFGLKVETIASKIRRIGFSCTQCGICCRGCCTDNRVMLLQQDILTISENTAIAEFSLPFVPVEVEDALNGISDSSSLIPYTDKDGNVHSFGWMLRRKENGDCFFLESAGLSYKCTIYKLRPALCRTYPFYLEECELHTSECEGLGSSISCDDSLVLAKSVLDRYIHELEERILMYQRYEYFDPIDSNYVYSLERFKKGHVLYIVHDSEGTHRRCERM